MCGIWEGRRARSWVMLEVEKGPSLLDRYSAHGLRMLFLSYVYAAVFGCGADFKHLCAESCNIWEGELAG